MQSPTPLTSAIAKKSGGERPRKSLLNKSTRAHSMVLQRPHTNSSSERLLSEANRTELCPLRPSQNLLRQNRTMTTSPVTCIRDPEINPEKLGALLRVMSASDSAIEDFDYLNKYWASDIPEAPVIVRANARREYRRIVAVQDDNYVGFLAGRINKSNPANETAYIALVAALVPGNGIGPKLLDKFVELALEEGMKQLRLTPDSGAGYEARVRFFTCQYKMKWSDDHRYLQMPIPRQLID